MIKLKEITSDNVDKVVSLELEESQKGFVYANGYSLAHAFISLRDDKIPSVPLAILNGEEVVGFLMYEYCVKAQAESDEQEDYFYDEPYYHLFRYMIGKGHQGKGYGKLAMEQLINHIKTKPQGEADVLFICFEPENCVAKKFYESFGFVDTGLIVEGENITKLAI